MGFHEVQLDTGMAYGSSGGPSFGNSIIELDSGADEVVQRWTSARHRYDLSYGLRSYERFAAVRSFLLARFGAANAWRFKDWSDFATTSTHVTHGETPVAVSHQDVVLGTGDGTTTAFQLIKRYSSGSQSYVRTLKKPVAGTVKVALNTTEQTSGFTVDTTTGVVLFSTAPTLGTLVKAGCEFDVPVRLEKDTDEWLRVSVDSFDGLSVPSLYVIEIPDPALLEEDLSPGGGTRWGNIAANWNISFLNGYAQSWSPTVGSLKAFLPDATDFEFGDYGHLKNEGAFDFLLRTADDAAVITVTTSQTVLVSLFPGAGSTKVWTAK